MKKIAIKWWGICLGLLVAGISSGQAQIIVLDMDDTNSGITSSTTILTDEGVGAPAIGTNDNQWGFSAANGQASIGGATAETVPLDNEAWGSRVDLGENAPLLTTTISGLNNSLTYNVYAYYVTDDGAANNWAIQVGLSGGSLTQYGLGDGVTLDQESSRNIERVLVATLGPTGGAIALDFDDAASGAGVRSFVKGVGVEAIPEPSTYALFLGGLGMLYGLRRFSEQKKKNK